MYRVDLMTKKLDRLRRHFLDVLWVYDEAQTLQKKTTTRGVCLVDSGSSPATCCPEYWHHVMRASMDACLWSTERLQKKAEGLL